MPSEHKLAAIMFTDIAGYTRLMNENEQTAMKVLTRNRQVQMPLVKRFQGEWIKEMGDGVLVSFNSVSNAVYCAGAIQKAVLQDEQLKLSIGIHLGEVIFSGRDVFGDGVNIASRLQAIAPAGKIYASQSVHENIVNKPGIHSTLVVEKQLKNIPKPIQVFQIEITAQEAYVVQEELLKNQPEVVDKSIAVLPFVNMSGEADQIYFSDGITEEIINVLAQIPQLKVVSRTSSFQFRGKESDVKSIANTLGVATILEGSVRKFKNRLRITAQLINAHDGFHLWSKTYERELKDLFELQDEIAKAIAQALQLKLLAADRPLSRSGTGNLQAYNIYLRGRFFWNKRTPVDLYKAIEFFNQALDLDPAFALAYSAVADVYNQLNAWGNIDPSVAAAKAKTAATRALNLDQGLGRANAALGFIQMVYEWDFEQAKANYLEAVTKSPNYASTYMWLGNLYEIIGESERGEIEATKATELDPLSVVININLARYYMCSGNHNKALEQAEKTMELGGEFPVHFTLYHTYYATGDHDRAFEHFVQWRSALGEDAAILEYGYSQSGWYGAAEAIIPVLNKKSEQEYVRAIAFAEYYVHLRNKTKALDYLELACRDKDAMVVTLGLVPIWRALYSESRFKKLIKRIGLPETA